MFCSTHRYSLSIYFVDKTSLTSTRAGCEMLTTRQKWMQIHHKFVIQHHRCILRFSRSVCDKQRFKKKWNINVNPYRRYRYHTSSSSGNASSELMTIASLMTSASAASHLHDSRPSVYACVFWLIHFRLSGRAAEYLLLWRRVPWCGLGRAQCDDQPDWQLGRSRI